MRVSAPLFHINKKGSKRDLLWWLNGPRWCILYLLIWWPLTSEFDPGLVRCVFSAPGERERVGSMVHGGFILYLLIWCSPYLRVGHWVGTELVCDVE